MALDKQELRIRIGIKIKMIRFQYRNDAGRIMTHGQFAKLLNKTEPIDIRIEPGSLGFYERGDSSVPGEKLEKIYNLDKSK